VMGTFVIEAKQQRPDEQSIQSGRRGRRGLF
jgi:hypothetical protein